MAKRLRDEDLRLNIIINGDNGRKQIGELERQIHDTTVKLDALKVKRAQMEKQGKTETAAYQRLNAQIAKHSTAIDTNRAKLEALRRQQQIETMTLSELRSHISRVNIELSKTNPGTPKWAALNVELRKSKARLAELSTQAKVTNGVMKNMASKINRYIGLITAFVASFAFVVTGINKSRKHFADYDEAVVDAMKTTNLTRKEVEELSNAFTKIDTRTAQNDLLGLARIAGKLGISTKEGVAEFVRAADIINVALSEDLGGNAEDAVREIGKLMDIFKIEEQFGMERGMLKTASAINELGISSTANEGYIVEFTKRVAGIAPNANISLQNILGLGGALDSLGQMSETSSTAFGQAISGMWRRTEAFSKVAKMSVKDFKDLLEKDANEAFIRVLEGMQGAEGGMEGVVAALDSLSFDGQRTMQVLGSLSGHTEELRRQQEISNKAFDEGTSAMNEFIKKNNTVQAQLEKRKKLIVDLSKDLGEKLMPVINFSLSGFTYLVKILGKVIDVSVRYKGIIIALGATMAAMNILKKIYILDEKRLLFYSEENIKTLRRQTMSMKTATASSYLLAAAKNVLAWNIKAATFAIRGFFIALGPVGWVITGVGLLAGTFSILKNRMSDLAEEEKKLAIAQDKNNKLREKTSSSIKEETEKIDSLFSRLKNAKEGTINYGDAKKQIIDKYGKYLVGLGKEIESLEDVEGAYNAISVAALQSAKDRAILDATKTSSNNYVTTELANLKGLNRLLTEKHGEKQGATLFASLKDSIISGKAYTDEVKKAIGSTEEWGNKTTVVFDKVVPRIPSLYEHLIVGIKDAKQVMETEISDINTIIGGLYARVNDDPDDVDDPTWSVGNDDKLLQARLNLKKQFQNGEIASEQEYNDKLLQLEIDALRSRLDLKIEEGAERLKLEEDLLDKLITQKKNAQQRQAEIDKLDADAQTDLIEKENDRYETEKLKFAGNKGALAAIEKVHLRNITKIKLDAVDGDVKRIEDKYKLERQLMVRQHKAELSTFKGSKNQKKKLAAEHNQELLELDTKHLTELATKLQQLYNSGLFDGTQIDMSLLSDEEKTKLLALIEDLQTQLKALGVLAEDVGYALFNSEGSLFGITESDWEQFFENLKKGKWGAEELGFAFQAIAGIVGELVGVYSEYDKYQSAVEDKQLKEYEKSNNEKKDVLKRRFDAGGMLEAQYNSEVAKLDEEYDQKKLELEIKQAKRQKAIAITNATINTLVEVTKVISNPIMAIIVGALGLAQIALIAATPIVGAEEGGFVAERIQDGKRFNAKLSPDKRGFITSPTVLVGENGGEYVIPNDGLQNPTLNPFISTIETARMNGTLKSIDFRSMYPIDSVIGREIGGFTTPTTSGAPTHTTTTIDNSQTNTELLKAIQKLDKKLDVPFPAYLSYLGKGGIKEAIDNYNKQQKRGKL